MSDAVDHSMLRNSADCWSFPEAFTAPMNWFLIDSESWVCGASLCDLGWIEVDCGMSNYATRWTTTQHEVHGSHVCPVTFVHPEYILFFLLISILTTCAPKTRSFFFICRKISSWHHTSRHRCPYNTITIQIDNCPIAHRATQMDPMPIQGMAPYVGPTI